MKSQEIYRNRKQIDPERKKQVGDERVQGVKLFFFFFNLFLSLNTVAIF